MEKAAAVTMSLHPIEKHKLRYTVYVGYGDSSSFGEVKESLQTKYGDNYTVRLSRLSRKYSIEDGN